MFELKANNFYAASKSSTIHALQSNAISRTRDEESTNSSSLLFNQLGMGKADISAVPSAIGK